MATNSHIRGKLVGLLVLVGILLSLSYAAKGPVSVGSKNFTEQLILGELMVQSLKAAGFNLNAKLALGGTAVVRKALESGEIDLYAEYTGTALMVHFKGYGLNVSRELWGNPKALFEFVRDTDTKRNNLFWLCPAPANNTYALAVRRDWAQRNKVATLVDLARYIKQGGSVVFASNVEFINRPDGLKAFEETYSFQIPRDKVVVIGQGSYATAQALANGSNGINVAMVFGTDGTIPAFDLVVLEDPKGAMPVYQPAPVVRGEILKKFPEIEKTLCGVFAKLDGKTLAELNGQVDVEGKRPQDVARDFLKKLGVVR